MRRTLSVTYQRVNVIRPNETRELSMDIDEIQTPTGSVLVVVVERNATFVRTNRKTNIVNCAAIVLIVFAGMFCTRRRGRL